MLNSLNELKKLSEDRGLRSHINVSVRLSSGNERAQRIMERLDLEKMI